MTATALGADPVYSTKERVKPIESTLTLVQTPQDRERYRIEFRKVGEKVLLFQGGKLFDTKGAPAIFVMDSQGRFYATTRYAPNLFNHLSFFSGEPVAAAGEMLVRAGELREMNNRSGHYVPNQEFHYQALYALEMEGVIPFRGINTVPKDWTPGAPGSNSSSRPSCSYENFAP